MPDSARSIRSAFSSPRTAPRAGTSQQILIDQAKREELTSFNGLRLLHKYLTRQAWNVEVNSSELSEHVLDRCRLCILPNPKAKFYKEELDALRSYVRDKGGSLLVLLGEAQLGNDHLGSNIGSLLEEFGVVGNGDAVIRTIFYKYFDPKEALVPNGIVNRVLAPASSSVQSTEQEKRLDSSLGRSSLNSRGLSSRQGQSIQVTEIEENNFQSALAFVYPYGCTLNVGKDSTPVLSTGTVCYPVNRPVCAFHKSQSGGKLVVVGSTHMFADEYLEKEDNTKIFDSILKYLTEAEVDLNSIDASDPDIADMHTIPDILQLSQSLKMCLQESEIEQAAHGDFIKLLDSTLQYIGLENWPEAIKSYELLGLKHEPLTLVPPIFEVPHAPLEPATFPPSFREISPPQLELFDLEDAFTSIEQRLAQLTNRCAEQDLDLFVREAGELLGIGRQLLGQDRNAKKVLERVLTSIIHYKSTGPDESDVPVPYDFPVAEPGEPDEGTNLNEPYDGGDDENEEPNYFSDIDEYDNLEDT